MNLVLMNEDFLEPGSHGFRLPLTWYSWMKTSMNLVLMDSGFNEPGTHR